MGEKYRNKYRIQSARLRNWDYCSSARYFVTICTHNRVKYFGKIVNGKMELSAIGIIANVFWYEIRNHVKNIELGEFVVMPNHVHGIIIITNNDNKTMDKTVDNTQPTQPTQSKNEFMAKISPKSNSLSVIVRSYKSAVSKHAHRLGYRFEWQARYHENIIRNNESFQRISNYIKNNPSKGE